jgi:outer membrane lipoprotein-sorting protein
MIRRVFVLTIVTICALAVTVLSTGQSVAASAAPQSIDDLIAKNLEAKGGLARLKAIQSIKQTVNLKIQGTMEAVMTVYSKRPNRMRQEIQVADKTVVNAFDGVTPWIINPMVGSTRPMAVTGPQADMLREQGDFDGPLVDYKIKGYTIALVGSETLGDRKVHHLRVVSQSQQVIHLYLDAATGLEAKRTTEIEMLKLEQEFSDYKPVDGITIPFTIRTFTNGVPQGEIRVKSVEFNVAMDDAIFRMPKG